MIERCGGQPDFEQDFFWIGRDFRAVLKDAFRNRQQPGRAFAFFQDALLEFGRFAVRSRPQKLFDFLNSARRGIHRNAHAFQTEGLKQALPFFEIVGVAAFDQLIDGISRRRNPDATVPSVQEFLQKRHKPVAEFRIGKSVLQMVDSDSAAIR